MITSIPFRRKLAQGGLAKRLQFDQFGKGLKKCLNHLRKVKRFSCLKKTTKLFWLTPTPQCLKMSDAAMKSFLKISQMTDEIAENEHFEIIDRLEAWLKADQELVTKETGHFSQYGTIQFVFICYCSKTMSICRCSNDQRYSVE